MNLIRKHKTAIAIILSLTLAGAILGATMAIVTKPTGATGQGCHWECGRYWYSVCVDWDYVCPTPSATPTASPTPTATPTPSSEPTITPEPSVEPSVEPTPVDNTDHTIRPAGVPQGPVCQKIVYAPTVLGYKRTTPNDVKVWWSKVDPFVSQYVVWFGLSKDKLVWNEVVTGNETTLHFIPSQSIWVGVQGLSDGCVGSLGEVIDP